MDAAWPLAGLDGGRAEAVRAMVLLSTGRTREALHAAQQVYPDPGESAASRSWAYTAAVYATAMLGRTAGALRLAGQGLRLAGQSSLARSQLRIGRGVALLLAGRLAEARQVAEDGYRETVTTANAGLAARWAGLRGFAAQLRGDLPLAVSSLRDAVALAEEQDAGRLHRVYLAAFAGTLAMTGDPAADYWLRRCDELPVPPPVYAALEATGRAWVATAAGDLPRARELAVRAAAQARAANQLVLEAFALNDAARLGLAHGVHKRLSTLKEQTDSELVAAHAGFAVAQVAGDGAALEKAAAAYADLEAAVLAAESMATAVRAYRSAGDVLAAARSRDLAVAMATRAPHARTPVLRALDGVADELTPRERQIATLAARSMSSREIADHLCLSIRTVDNHLGNVYRKLGVSGRAELATLLAR